MDEKRQYLEKVRHGTAMFPAEYYDCRYPLWIPSLPVHWHGEFEISYVRKGRCVYMIDLKPWKVETGDILLLPPGILHGIPEDGLELLESDSFVFHPEFLGTGDELCRMKYIEPLRKGEIWFAPVIKPDAPGAGIMKNVLNALRDSFEEKSRGYELEVKALLLEMMSLFYRYLPYETKDAGESEAVGKIRDVVRYIRQHYAEPVTVAELAEVCHLSEYYFMRFFKQHMNMTCVEYLNQYRLELAAARLVSGKESVTDIALDTGFRNISYFNRVFKRKFGMTPGEYRKLRNEG